MGKIVASRKPIRSLDDIEKDDHVAVPVRISTGVWPVEVDVVSVGEKSAKVRFTAAQVKYFRVPRVATVTRAQIQPSAEWAPLAWLMRQFGYH